MRLCLIICRCQTQTTSYNHLYNIDERIIKINKKIVNQKVLFLSHVNLMTVMRKTQSNILRILALYLPLILSVLSLPTYATHISKPIPHVDKQEFLPNDIIKVKGWVKYDNAPASEVLVGILLEKENKKLIAQNSTSDANGNFSTSLSIPENTTLGNYTIEVVSFCKDIHRNICTLQYAEIPISIVAGK